MGFVSVIIVSMLFALGLPLVVLGTEVATRTRKPVRDPLAVNTTTITQAMRSELSPFGRGVNLVGR